MIRHTSGKILFLQKKLSYGANEVISFRSLALLKLNKLRLTINAKSALSILGQAQDVLQLAKP